MFHIISISNVALKKYEEKGRGEYLYGGGRKPGTGWVRSGSKFDQNRVGGRDRAIREQVGQHNIRDCLGGIKQYIRE